VLRSYSTYLEQVHGLDEEAQMYLDLADAVEEEAAASRAAIITSQLAGAQGGARASTKQPGLGDEAESSNSDMGDSDAGDSNAAASETGIGSDTGEKDEAAGTSATPSGALEPTQRGAPPTTTSKAKKIRWTSDAGSAA